MYPYAHNGSTAICVLTATAAAHIIITSNPAKRSPMAGSLTYDGFSAGIKALPLIDDQDIYTIIGEEGFTRLVAAFYRQVRDTLHAEIRSGEADDARWKELEQDAVAHLSHGPFAIGA